MNLILISIFQIQEIYNHLVFTQDGELIANVGSEVFSYRDEPLENMVEYCFSLGSNYDE